MRGATSTRHLHFANKPKRRAPIKLAAAVAAAVAVAVVILVVVAATEPVPKLRSSVLLSESVKLPGPGPQLAWPATGEAAVEVAGMPPLGTAGGDAPVPIASVAKVMTAYVVLHDHPLRPGQPGFSVTITPADVADYEQRAAQAQSVVRVEAGESISERQLLEGLLVASGNNLAVILADEDAGSVAGFVARMNSTARSLGMTSTTYTDPSGLESSTVSTASEQLLLAGRAMADPSFAAIVAMPTIDLPAAGTLTNFDKAVGTGGYVGIKTGSDSSAGGCVVFANHQTVAGRPITILGVVLGQKRGTESTPTLLGAVQTAVAQLVASVTASVAPRVAVPAGAPIADVHSASGGHVRLVTASAVAVVGFGGQAVPVRVTLAPLGTRLAAGQMVGRLTVDAPPAGSTAAGSTGAGSSTAGSSTAGSDLRSSGRLPAVSFGWRLLHVL